jgi:hypothetical protein
MPLNRSASMLRIVTSNAEKAANAAKAAKTKAIGF